jgi:DNA-binding MarR family transcriptional regulator
MMTKNAEILRNEIRYAEGRVNDFCAKQVPTEMFHYTLSQMRTIRTLYSLTRELPGGVQLKVLAERLAVTPAAASEMVDTLVRKGALIRRSDPSDRRAVLLQVGDQLRERFENCEEKLDLLALNFLKTLSAAEVETIVEVSRKFSAFVSDSENLPEA